jgi:hypothetical protein
MVGNWFQGLIMTSFLAQYVRLRGYGKNHDMIDLILKYGFDPALLTTRPLSDGKRYFT